MNYKLERFLLMTLDPVHIGTGGYRLGRVDNSIVREPGTNLPKIPGTSLSGAVRAYAAYRYESPDCAGQGRTSEKSGYAGHCGGENCPICYTFGSLKTKASNGEQRAYAGVVNIFDAHIVFFPVYSMAGPVWVSTKSRLKEFGFIGDQDQKPSRPEACLLVGSSWKQEQKVLNLGWLMLEARPGGSVTPPSNSDLEENGAWKVVVDHLVLVTDEIFSQVVNSNLEVRTSVAIDPLTGAAQEGALFTYEAIPRATWLVMDVVEDNYRQDEAKPWPVDKKAVYEEHGENGRIIQHNAGGPLGETWSGPMDVVKAGLKLIEILGVGGMGTRGFGRIRMIKNWLVDSKGSSDE